MTKGITKFFIGAALFAGVATADTDLFAKLSNGAMSDKSEGITELSREQKAKVVGGYYAYETSFFNYRDGGYSFQTGMIFQPSTNQEYSLLSYVIDINTEDIVMLTRYNYSSRNYNYQFVAVDYKTGRMKRTVWGAGPADILGKYEQQAQRHNARLR